MLRFCDLQHVDLQRKSGLQWANAVPEDHLITRVRFNHPYVPSTREAGRHAFNIPQEIPDPLPRNRDAKLVDEFEFHCDSPSIDPPCQSMSLPKPAVRPLLRADGESFYKT